MIQQGEEIELTGTGDAFWDYKFSATARHSERHLDFSDMEILICDGSEVFACGDVDLSSIGNRRWFRDQWKKVLARVGVDEVYMSIAYFGIDDEDGVVREDRHDDYVAWRDTVVDWLCEMRVPGCIVTHFHQLDKSMTAPQYPHAHLARDGFVAGPGVLNGYLERRL